MSIKILISIDVPDYNKMLSAFDAGASARANAGISAKAYQNFENPNNAWVICEAESKKAFSDFFTSPGQQERMKDAGLQSRPKITFLKPR